MLSSHQLPPELFDIIIDLLHADQAALATCALVCKSWLPASRHHLYGRLVITEPDPYMDSPIFKILSSHRSTVASSVQQLVLHGFEGIRICPITTIFSCIQMLSLSDFPVLKYMPLLQNLESLELINIIVHTAGLLSILHSQLQRVSFSNISFGSNSSPHLCAYSPCALMPSLTSFTLHRSDMLLDWILVHWESAVPALTKVDLSSSSYTTERARRVLEVVGSRLQVLQLSGFPEPPGEFSSARSAHLLIIPGIVTARSFTFLTQLRSFSLDLHGGGPNDVIRFTFQALRQLPSPSLQDLSIPLTVTGNILRWVDRDVWSELASLLESPPFLPNLRTLRFNLRMLSVHSQDASVAIKQWLAEMFPLCEARGILRFRYVDWRGNETVSLD
jgi:hypothetical protein